VDFLSTKWSPVDHTSGAGQGSPPVKDRHSNQ